MVSERYLNIPIKRKLVKVIITLSNVILNPGYDKTYTQKSYFNTSCLIII